MWIPLLDISITAVNGVLCVVSRREHRWGTTCCSTQQLYNLKNNIGIQKINVSMIYVKLKAVIELSPNQEIGVQNDLLGHNSP